MKAKVNLIWLLFLFANLLIAQSADDIIGKSIAIVEENDKRVELASGTFKLKLILNYDLRVKKGNYEFLYDVKFKDGKIKERKLAAAPDQADSMSLQIARLFENVRNDENLKIKNLVFPFLRVTNTLKQNKINYKLIGAEKFNGEECFIVTVNYEVGTDTAGSEGKGKIWIRKEDYVPIKCEYDVLYWSKRSSKIQSKQFLDLSEVDSFIIPIRNEVQVFPKVLFVKFGTVKMIYESGEFKFENKF